MRRDPLRVGFVLTELVGGGAERSMLSIIDALDRSRFAPTLFVFTDRAEHAPPRRVPVVVLPGRAPSAALRLVARERYRYGLRVKPVNTTSRWRPSSAVRARTIASSSPPPTSTSDTGLWLRIRANAVSSVS